MKTTIRISAFFIAIFLVTGLLQPDHTFAEDMPIPIFVDNAEISFDVQPYIANGVMMAPIRAIAEGLGTQVDWVSPAVTFSLGGNTVTLSIGSDTAIINDEPVTLSTVPIIKQGRTFVPLRFVSENLGVTVQYTHGEVYIWKSTPMLMHSGNTMNGSSIAETESALFWTQDGDIYREDKATGQTEKLALTIIENTSLADADGNILAIDKSINAGVICVDRNILYFTNSANNMPQILAVDLSNGNTTLVHAINEQTSGINTLQVYGNSLYIHHGTPPSSQALKVSLADYSYTGLSSGGAYNGGTGASRGYPASFCISGGYIYIAEPNRLYGAQYTGETTTSITKLTLSGKVVETLYSAQGTLIDRLSAYDGKLYFRTHDTVGENERWALCNISTDGSDFETVLDEMVNTYNVDGGYLYYSADALYKIVLESKEKTTLADETTNEIISMNNSLYYKTDKGIVALEL